MHVGGNGVCCCIKKDEEELMVWRTRSLIFEISKIYLSCFFKGLLLETIVSASFPRRLCKQRYSLTYHPLDGMV